MKMNKKKINSSLVKHCYKLFFYKEGAIMLKKVDVKCPKAFVLNGATFSGYVRNIILSTDDIRKCLECKAKVFEILPNGSTLALDFANYDDNNGGEVKEGVSETDWKHLNEPKVEVIGKPQYNHIDKNLTVDKAKPTVKEQVSFTGKLNIEPKKEKKTVIK